MKGADGLGSADYMVHENLSRLSPLAQDTDLLPLRRAHQMTRCALYWVPVSSFPIPSAQRLWINSFLDRVLQLMQESHGLRAEVFLQCKTVFPSLVERLNENALDLTPLMGLAQRPGQEIPPIPTVEDLQQVLKEKEKYDFKKFVGDFCYWFIKKDAKKQRDLFWGYGGMTILFLAPDPSTKVAPLQIPKWIREDPGFAGLFKLFDPDQANANSHALLDGFRKKSLDLFAEDLKKNVQLKGMPFVIPLLSTRDFFNRPEEECKKWLELFDLYVNESPADDGVLIASKLDVEEELIAILNQMKADGLQYPLDRT
jgi:hypothetical protein